MSLDYSKLTDDELDAIANDDYSRLSDATLQAIAGEAPAQGKPSSITTAAPNPVDYAAPTAMGTAAGAARPLMGGAATANARDALNIAKNVTALTPNSLMEMVSHPVSTAKAYVAGHPWANTPVKQIATGVGKNVAGAVAQGLMAPETAFAAPYQMAAYEQEKIRQNPNAPQYATNPYAQMTRGEAPTQGAAGAMNRRNAIAGQQYGGVTPEEQMMLDQDRLRQQEIQNKKIRAQQILQQPPTAQNFIERMTAMSALYGDVNQG